jgi:hypothetical protein
MKKHLIILALFVSLVCQASAASVDPDTVIEVASPWSGGVEMAATDKYLWRGMTVNEGFILQPDAWLTYQNFTFTLWGSITTNEPVNDIKRNEIDAIASYELNINDFVIEGSFLYYHYIDQPDAPNTGELACTVSYPFGIMTLNAGVIVDVIEYPGAAYLEQKIEVEKDLSDCLVAFSALTLGSGLKKFNESYLYDENDNPFSKSTLSLISIEGRLTYSTVYGIYLQPYFQLNKTINNDLKDYLKKQSSSIGLIIGKEF